MDIYLRQEKFHRITFKFYRVSKLKKSEQTIRNLLCYYQELACKKYASEGLMTATLGNFYDAKYRVGLTNFGSYSVMEYSLTAIDPLYIEDKDYNLEKLENLFKDLIEAKMGQGKAMVKLFNRAFEIYKSDLLDHDENLQAVAFNRAISTYFKGTERDFSSYGCLDELEKITPDELYKYYQKVKKEESIMIASGNIDEKNNNPYYTLKPKKNYHFRKRNSVEKTVKVSADSTQCYLEIFYETNTFADDELYYATMLLNYVFGGHSNSKLFRTVREKYGLCYSINSMYLGATGIIVVSAIINLVDLDKTLKAIEECEKELKAQDFEIEEARNYYISALANGLDYLETAVNNYLADNFFLDTPKSDKELECLRKVTKEDVYQAFLKLKQSFVFVYGGDKVE